MTSVLVNVHDTALEGIIEDVEGSHRQVAYPKDQFTRRLSSFILGKMDRLVRTYGWFKPQVMEVYRAAE